MSQIDPRDIIIDKKTEVKELITGFSSKYKELRKNENFLSEVFFEKEILLKDEDSFLQKYHENAIHPLKMDINKLTTELTPEELKRRKKQLQQKKSEKVHFSGI